MTKRIFFFALGLLMVLVPFLAGADIYKYVDGHGHVHLTDRPDHAGYRRLIKTWKGWAEAKVDFKNIFKNRQKYSPTIAEAANLITSFDAAGFTVGSATDVNQAGATYHYVAWRSVANSVTTGQYSGNGVAGSTVTVGFMPSLVFVKSPLAIRAIHRSNAIRGDSALAIDL